MGGWAVWWAYSLPSGQSQARRAPAAMSRGPPRLLLLRPLLLLALVLLGQAEAAFKKPSANAPGAPSAKEVEPVIEEVTAKQLERVLNEKDFVAVYWCKCAS